MDWFFQFRLWPNSTKADWYINACYTSRERTRVQWWADKFDQCMTILDHPQQQQYTLRLQRNSRTETDQLRFHMVSCMHNNKYPITPVLGCGMGVHWQFRICSTFALIVCVCQCCAVCISWFNYGWYSHSQNTVQYNLRLHWTVFWQFQP